MNELETKIIHRDTRNVIHEAVNELVDFVKPTYGPASNKVIISKMTHKMLIDDGVQIARDFESDDPAKNAVINVVKEVAIRTNDRVGDGTTGALIMVQAIINEVNKNPQYNGRQIELELKQAGEEAVKQIREQAVKIETKEDLEKVARISFDNKEVADKIAEVYSKVGPDGVVTVGKSLTNETEIEMQDGIIIDTGYLSEYMITNPSRMEAVIEKPLILVTDYRLTEASDVVKLLNKLIAADKRELVIIAENVEQHALATIVINRAKGVFNVLAIPAPKVNNRKVALEDIALMTGAKLFSESKGNKIDDVTIEDLGKAERIVSKKTETIIIDPKGEKADIAFAITSLREAIENEQDEKSKKEMEERLARFTNSIAVIKVGGKTENEHKALRYKVEDAINAVKEAYRGGVVCGSGLTLARITTSSRILNKALKQPAIQLRENMGLDTEINIQTNEAHNVVTDNKGPFMEVGVMDPAEVLIAGVESAISIANLLMTCHGIIVETPRKPKVVNE